MSAADKKPEIVVFAGPNGSGKSTITSMLRPTDMVYINADDIQRALGCDMMEAAQLAEARREEQLRKKENFCFETVLSTDRNLKLLQRAKEVLYPVLLCPDGRSADQRGAGGFQSCGRRT